MTIEKEMRPMIRFIKHGNIYNTPLTGVEVGVQYGTNSMSILKELTLNKLYLIDPFIDCEDVVYPIFKKNVLNKSEYNDKVVFIKKRSCDAINDLPNNLDFVYLDGSGRCDEYYNDIIAYHDKLSPNGVIGGNLGWEVFTGRKFALLQYLKEKNQKMDKVYFRYHDFPTRSKGGTEWWMIKK